jgi:cardiolipin synthase
MYLTNWKKEIWSIPNLLSLFRLFLIPVYLSLYLRADSPGAYTAAAVVLALSCLTDLLDGKIARRFNMVTNLGKVLDPLADKLTQLVMIICLSLRHKVMRYLLILFLIKEFFQFFAMIAAMRHGKGLNGALMSGKISTTVLFTSLIILVLMPDLPQSWVSIISSVCLVFLLYAFGDYILAYYGKNKKIYDLE